MPLAGNANRIANGETTPEPTPAKGGDTFTQPTVMARIHQYLSMATPLLWTRQPDTVGVLGLALNATEEENGRPPGELERIRELLLCARCRRSRTSATACARRDRRSASSTSPTSSP